MLLALDFLPSCSLALLLRFSLPLLLPCSLILALSCSLARLSSWCEGLESNVRTGNPIFQTQNRGLRDQHRSSIVPTELRIPRYGGLEASRQRLGTVLIMGKEPGKELEQRRSPPWCSKLQKVER